MTLTRATRNNKPLPSLTFKMLLPAELRQSIRLAIDRKLLLPVLKYPNTKSAILKRDSPSLNSTKPPPNYAHRNQNHYLDKLKSFPFLETNQFARLAQQQQHGVITGIVDKLLLRSDDAQPQTPLEISQRLQCVRWLLENVLWPSGRYDLAEGLIFKKISSIQISDHVFYQLNNFHLAICGWRIRNYVSLGQLDRAVLTLQETITKRQRCADNNRQHNNFSKLAVPILDGLADSGKDLRFLLDVMRFAGIQCRPSLEIFARHAASKSIPISSQFNCIKQLFPSNAKLPKSTIFALVRYAQTSAQLEEIWAHLIRLPNCNELVGNSNLLTLIMERSFCVDRSKAMTDRLVDCQQWLERFRKYPLAESAVQETRWWLAKRLVSTIPATAEQAVEIEAAVLSLIRNHRSSVDANQQLARIMWLAAGRKVKHSKNERLVRRLFGRLGVRSIDDYRVIEALGAVGDDSSIMRCVRENGKLNSQQFFQSVCSSLTQPDNILRFIHTVNLQPGIDGSIKSTIIGRSLLRLITHEHCLSSSRQLFYWNTSYYRSMAHYILHETVRLFGTGGKSRDGMETNYKRILERALLDHSGNQSEHRLNVVGLVDELDSLVKQVQTGQDIDFAISSMEDIVGRSSI